MNRLLIVACSQRKNPTTKPLPAIERYDGPAFRVLRKFLRERRRAAPKILILSGKHGLIDAQTPISNYDVRMTRASAQAFRPDVLARLTTLMAVAPIQSIGVCLGQDYDPAVDELRSHIPQETTIETLGGGLGQRLTRLKNWLHRNEVVYDNGERGEKTCKRPNRTACGQRMK
jgi:hypothetical protein